jgi:hypothetical protein
MNQRRWLLIVVAALILFLGWRLVHNDHIFGGVFVPAQVNALNDKYDGDCTGHETAGRCADKCPEGYFERGTDRETGAAICATVTGCPYGDSIPLGPECDKQAPQQPAATTEPAPVDYVPAENVMGGGK